MRFCPAAGRPGTGPLLAPSSGAPVATSLANSSSLDAVLTTFPAAVLTITHTITHAPSGLRVHRSVDLQVNFPPTGPTAAVTVDAPQGPLVAGVTPITLSTPAASWSPFLSAGAPLVLPSFPTRAVFKDPDLLRTALNHSPQGPPTANRQPPIANRQPPTAANRRQPPTANRQPLK